MQSHYIQLAVVFLWAVLEAVSQSTFSYRKFNFFTVLSYYLKIKFWQHHLLHVVYSVV